MKDVQKVSETNGDALGGYGGRGTLVQPENPEESEHGKKRGLACFVVVLMEGVRSISEKEAYAEFLFTSGGGGRKPLLNPCLHAHEGSCTYS